MADLLSQEEIDTLLSTLSSKVKGKDGLRQGEKKDVKKYDFRSPNKFSQEQLRALQMLHKHFARIASTTLSARLRSFVSLDLSSMEQMAYDDFIGSIPSPTVLAIYTLSPLEGSAILEINSKIGFSVIERLFGGEGNGLEQNREITDIEAMVIEKMIIELLKDYQEVWNDVTEVSPNFVELETNPQFVQVVSESDIVLVISFTLTIEEFEGRINLCIPHLLLEPVLNKLSAHYWFSGMQKKQTNSQEEFSHLEKRINKTWVPVSALLGSTDILVKDFIELEECDVIKLDKRVDEKINILVGNRSKFLGKPGVEKGKLAVKISKIVEDFEEVGEDDQ